MKTIVLTTAIGVLSIMNSAQAQSTWSGNNYGTSNSINYTNGWNGSTISYTTSYGYQPYNYGTSSYTHNNMGYMKRVAKNSIRESAFAIRNAVHASNWNDMYSPLIAKAIRHQQYAKTLYMQRNLTAAINHSNRAAYLANQATNYITAMNNYGAGYMDDVAYGYNDIDDDDGVYMDNGMNYRGKNTTTTSATQNRGSQTAPVSAERKRAAAPQNARAIQVEENELDKQLPTGTNTDKELLKIDMQKMLVE